MDLELLVIINKMFYFKNIFPDLAEAKALVKELGLDYTAAQIEEFFKKFDADNSGELDKEEAKALVKAIRPDIFQ